MPSFSPKELREFLNSNSLFSNISTSDFAENIISDYVQYIEQSKITEQDFSNFGDEYLKPSGWTIPSIYKGEELSYFLLFHIARTFIDSYFINNAIRTGFNKIDSISSIQLISGTGDNQSIPIENSPNNNGMESDIREAFTNLGILILGDRFKIEDFIKQ